MTDPIGNCDAVLRAQLHPHRSRLRPWATCTYDAAGNRTSETRPTEDVGTVTDTCACDLSGRLTRSVKAAGTDEEAATAFTYDLLGRQKTAALGEPSTKTYNTLSWVLAETDFDG
ncbi:MAG: hypothetical protein IBX63_10425, partial [Coriobacteriia bacterium]|nr:hypothetical protein [Coriobacteriia bacterium]